MKSRAVNSSKLDKTKSRLNQTQIVKLMPRNQQKKKWVSPDSIPLSIPAEAFQSWVKYQEFKSENDFCKVNTYGWESERSEMISAGWQWIIIVREKEGEKTNPRVSYAGYYIKPYSHAGETKKILMWKKFLFSYFFLKFLYAKDANAKRNSQSSQGG